MPWVKLGLAALMAGVALGGAVAMARSLSVGSGASGGGTAPLAVLRTNDFHALAFAPSDPNVAFFGHHNGLLRTDDGGRTWTPLVERPNFDAMGLAVSRADPKQIYIAGHDVFQESADGGATWQPVQHALPGTDIHGFAISPDDPNRLYAFVNPIGLFASANGGGGARTWQRLTQAPAGIMALAAAGGAAAGGPDTLYAGSMSAGVVRSADGGQTWTPASSGLTSTRVLALATDPTSMQTLYAGTDAGLFKTTDGGAAWAKLPFPGKNAVAIAVSPARPERVLAIYQDMNGRKGDVFRSDDGGQTWSQ